MTRSWVLILPMLNKSVITFSGPVCYICDHVSLRTITDEMYGLLHRDESSKFRSIVNPQTKCVYAAYDNREPANWSEFTRNETRKVQTLFNFLSDGNPALIGPAAIFSQKRKATLYKTVEFDAVANIENLTATKYRLLPTITREILSGTYQIIDDVCNRHREMSVTLDRYNSSLVRGTWPDKIIDTTISLESLIQSSTELRFKFSLYLSFIVGSDSDSRSAAFGLLKNLYDVRSSLVHGSHGRKEEQQLATLIEKWKDVEEIAKEAINYYIFYLYYNQNTISWEDHLRRLVFGIDKRIVD